MVRANRWTREEFTSNPEAFLRAAKDEGPQLLIETDARYTMSCERLSGQGDGIEFLAKGGPDPDES